MINILVCDDDSEWLMITSELLYKLSRKYNIIVKILTYNDVLSIPADVIRSKNIDIAYLDIELKDGENGIELAKEIQKYNKWAVILFLTNHREFTKEAFFEVQAFGYLGKPIKHNIFENYYQKAILQVSSIKNKTVESVLEFYYEKLLTKIRQKEIFFMERIGRKTKVKTMKKAYMINDSIKQLEERLDGSFLKISQSVIVNMKEISYLSKSICCLKTGEEFGIGRTFRNTVKDTYDKFFIL